MSSWRRFFSSEAKRSELDEEIAAHLAMAEADNRAAGADAATAHHKATAEFGNAALVKDVTSSSWGWQRLESFAQDARYAIRQMRKGPGFACAVIGTLALGIGAATAMFTVVDRTMLRPLPYKHPSRLVTISPAGKDQRLGFQTSFPDIQAWREQAKSFEGFAFYRQVSGRSFLNVDGTATQVALTQVSGNLFGLLGVTPQFGSGLRARPDTLAVAGDDHTVVINDLAWREIFHSDRGIVGRTVQINDEPYRILGVMPKGFYFPYNSITPQLWSPIQLGADDAKRSYASQYQVMGRVKAGITIAQANAEMQQIQMRIQKSIAQPDWAKDIDHIKMDPFASIGADKSTNHALLALLGASGLLWLIACLNATNLLLVKASVRAREIAMRGALGASRWRLTQQLVIEGLLLSMSAALLGIALALSAITLFNHLLSHLPTAGLAPFAGIVAGLSPRVLLLLIALTVISAILSSAWPAWMAARSPIEAALRQGGAQSGTAKGQNRLRGGLVIAEIAMSLALLACCGLLLRTIYALRHTPLGFRTDHILVANMEIPTYRFAKINAAQEIYMPLLERAQHLPGVQSAGLVTEVPLGNTFNVMMYLEGDKAKGLGTTSSMFKAATPDLQKVFGFSILKGRYFNEHDTPSSEPVAVVNQAFAKAFAPHEQDLNKVIGLKLMSISNKPGEKNENTKTTIIGILDDMHQWKIGVQASPEIQVLPDQVKPGSSFYAILEGVAMDLAVRTQRPPSEMIPQLRAILKQASPELADAKFSTMDQIVEDSFGSQQLAAKLLEVFAGSALLLCVAGLYGLLAYVVSQRTREMGVRFALGAQKEDVVWLVMRQAGVLVIAGIVIGMGLAYGAGRLVQSFLFGISAHDGWTLAAVAILLMICGGVAAWLPARRAAGVNPVEALRAE
ncbi:ABC transporter permease [Silvibacterium acidisoli]|uniref:ABC transporter permease n=1 Tax=Acidobacteriaceae bacterium ZG23-2 TaxID=2883246 RepID=UPI00406C8217